MSSSSGSDSVVVRITTFTPVVSWLFREIRESGHRLHILQAKLYGRQQAKRRSMLHGEGLPVKIRGEQRLGMAGSGQIDGNIIGVGISGTIQIDRRLDPHPLSLRGRWVSTKQIVESQTRPPRNRAPAFDANQPRNLLVDRKT